MPTHKSAEKRIRTNEKARIANKAARSEIRTSLKKVRAATSKVEAQAEIPNLFALLDKAARKRAAGVTKNTASNYKRKVHLGLAKLTK